jgi:hypothetical protein
MTLKTRPKGNAESIRQALEVTTNLIYLASESRSLHEVQGYLENVGRVLRTIQDLSAGMS